MGNGGSTSNPESSSNPDSSANSRNVRPGVTVLLEDALYELHSPPKGTPVEIDIIFFHGLQISDYKDAYWKTWSSDGETIWQQTLLADVFPRARILAVSYDSSARVSNTRIVPSVETIGENLVKQIIEDKKSNVGREDRLVMLVGHSFGGFAMKQFIMQAYEKKYRPDSEGHMAQNKAITDFFDNLCGIFYYATPHGGSRLADAADKLPGNSAVLQFLKTLGKDAARLNDKFREWRGENKIPAYTIAESRKTKHWGVNFIVVEEASARFDTDDFYTAPEDHLSICKPTSTNSATFRFFEQFVDTCVEQKQRQPLTRGEEQAEELAEELANLQ